MAAVTNDLIAEVEQFLYREARLQDAHEYDAWEELWDTDGVYWLPASSEADPNTSMSIIYDNRSRIRTRIRQLKTGKRHAQTPRSSIVHFVSNVEVLEVRGDHLAVTASLLVVEARGERSRMWAGRADYGLRRTGNGLKLASKKVSLVDRDQPLPTLGFLI